MKLNIYKGGEVEKTYETPAYDLMFGTCEDILAALNIDEMKTGSNVELVKMAYSFVANNMGMVKDLIREIFPGVTDEEIRRTKAKDVATIFVDVVKYAFAEIKKDATGKN